MEEALAAKQDVESRFATTEAQVADGSARFEALRQSSDAERASALKESEGFRQRIEQLVNDLSARETELAEARRKIEGNAVAQEAMERQLVVKGEELSRLTTDLDTARRELADHLAKAQDEAAAVQQEAAAKIENLGRVYEAKSAAQREEAAQAALLLDEALTQLKRELSESNKHADSMEGRVAALQADLQRGQKEAGEVRAELEAARQAQKKAADETVEKEKQIAEFVVQLAAAQEAEKGVRARAGDAERDFRAQLEGANQTVEQARRSIADRDRLAEELARAKGDLSASMETVREARQERDAVRLTVDSLELQIEENLDLFHAAEAERDALKAELEAVRAGLERAKQHVNVLQSRRDQMREEIARLKLQLGQSPDSAS
jgi:chromosome segregation ATPase